ncbi:hypothetical protein [Sphingomonas glaciei]|uniref:Autotransporter domain-containing protein n=1 Tax=Sphingomonas glaciei TaxID=2938948 RepID=A0ABY5MXA0_9SPHN|nr:hypothetical protein [Sphingomonas glaciei]UUR06976.1 hypothetical protein M1K48_08395 [Sphingomonas glaciei]
MTSRTKFALLSTVSAAAAMFALPGAASAQSTTCSQSGTSVTCVDGTTTVLTATTDATTTTLPGTGLITVNTTAPSTISYTATGPIATTAATGVNLTSTGGALNFTPIGTTAPVRITTTGGTSANGLTINATGQDATVTVGAISTTGTSATPITTASSSSFGVRVDGARNLTLTTGDITTTGAGSRGIQTVLPTTGDVSITAGNFNTADRAISVSSGTTSTNAIRAGNITSATSGVLANGGAVNLTVGNVVAANGFGVVGQNFAGSTGGITIRTGTVTSTNGNGISALLNNATGAIDIGGCSNVTTTAVSNSAIFAQTSGAGNVTINCGAVSATGNSGVFALSQGGNVLVNTTSVRSTQFEGVLASTTSTGTVTTNAGAVTTTGAADAALQLRAGTGLIDAGFTSLNASGAGAFGVDAVSTGNVNLRGGTITATGDNSTGVFVNGAGLTGTVGAVSLTGINSRGIVFVPTGTAGTVNLTTGAVSTTNDGIVIATGTGPITLVTGAVTTTEVDAPAVTLASTGAITVTTGLLTTGAGSAARANSPGLLITGGAGAVTATVAGASVTGANSDAISIVSGGPVSVTNTGTIAVSGANSVGIDVATTGTGAVNVTTGVVTSTAANLAADPSFAAVRVVAAGAAPVAVVANGNITTAAGSGIWAQTAGTASVTVNSGVTVTGPTAITLGGATGNSLLVNGTLNSTTAGTSGYVLAPGAGPLTLTLGTAGSISGPLAFGAGNDTFINNRTAGFTQSGALNFGAGNDTFNTSTIFTQNAAIAFGDGNDSVNNTGVYNATGTTDFGAGTDTFNNGTTGTGALAGTLNVFNGATFTGLEAFNNNAGLIDLRDGATGDVLNLGTANYTATGNARLGVDVGIANGVFTADRLVYSGTTTGITTILPTFLTGVVIDTTGALVVDAGTVAAGQFVLAGPTNAGLVNFGLETRGSDVFLVGRPDEATADLLFVNRLGNDIWYQSAEAYQAYAMSRRVDFGNERKSPVGIWAQLYNSKERFGDRNRSTTAFGTALTTSGRFETKRRGAQGGIEFGAPSFLVGATAGYEHAEGGTDFGTNLDAEGYNYGVYGQFGGQQGLYAGVLLKRDVYDVRVTNSSVGALTVIPEGKSTGIDGEVGFRFGNPGTLNFDLGAGLSYVRSRVDDYNFGNLSFDNDRYTSTRGRLQARASFAAPIAPFIDGKVFHEFGDASDLVVRSGALTTGLVDQKRGTWGRIEAGIGGGAGGGPLLSAFVDLGDVRGWGVRGGFRF